MKVLNLYHRESKCATIFIATPVRFFHRSSWMCEAAKALLTLVVRVNSHWGQVTNGPSKTPSLPYAPHSH